jgi:hypothetical protein
MIDKFIPRKYHAPIQILGAAAILVLIFGRIFDALTKDRVDRGEASVIIQAIPFASIFITIILIFILLIFLVAIRFNGKLAYRTYRPVELLTIAGIGGGIFAVFQPWEIVSYRYGFLLLLGSTIFFILWSHVVPRSAKSSRSLAPFHTAHHIVGLVVALAVFGAMLFLVFGSFEQPSAPYGESARRWEFMRDEQKIAIAEEAEHDYDYIRYTIAVMLLLPTAACYFISREVAATMIESPPYPVSSQPNIASLET